MEDNQNPATMQLRHRAEQLAAALLEFKKAALAVEHDHTDPEAEQAREKIQAAIVVVSDSKLDLALSKTLLGALKPWHYRKANSSGYISESLFDAEFCRVEVLKKPQEYGSPHTFFRYSFSFRGKPFLCTLLDKGLRDGDHNSEVELWSNDALVLKVWASDDGQGWRPFSVEAFRSGPWMQDLLEIAAQIERRKEADKKRDEDARVKEEARNFEL